MGQENNRSIREIRDISELFERTFNNYELAKKNEEQKIANGFFDKLGELVTKHEKNKEFAIYIRRYDKLLKELVPPQEWVYYS